MPAESAVGCPVELDREIGVGRHSGLFCASVRNESVEKNFSKEQR
jgi:hypothetical protein